MEKINKKISVENHKRYIEEMSFFGWEVENVNIEEPYAFVTLIRDPNMKNYDRIKELEKQWFSFKYPPLWPMIVLCGLAFILITALLVIWLVNKGEGFDGGFYFLVLGLPAFGLMILSTVWFGYRITKMKRVFTLMDEERVKIKSEANILLGKNENEEKES